MNMGFNRTNIWSSKKGSVEKFENVRFVSNLAVFNKSRTETIKTYMNIEKYPEFMPQYTVGKIIKKEGSSSLVQLIQDYK